MVDLNGDADGDGGLADLEIAIPKNESGPRLDLKPTIAEFSRRKISHQKSLTPRNQPTASFDFKIENSFNERRNRRRQEAL